MADVADVFTPGQARRLWKGVADLEQVEHDLQAISLLFFLVPNVSRRNQESVCRKETL